MFSDFVKRYDGKCLVSTVDGNIIYIFTTRDIGNELALLEVTFKGTKIDVQKNLTQDEKKDIHGLNAFFHFSRADLTSEHFKRAFAQSVLEYSLLLQC
jgi:hypothetical protein